MEQVKFIPLSVPNFGGREKEYVNDAVVSEWVSTGGSKVPAFEQAIADFVGMPTAVACNSGTSGLHLAMLAAGVQPHDLVLAPTLTFIAAVNPIRYCFADPVFIGCDDSLGMDPAAVRAFCENECEMRGEHLYHKASGRRVSAMSIVHVFGNLADMESLLPIARQYNIAVIEDATEALGSYYTEGEFAGKFAGTIGDVGVYSFNGNKIMTTGSGGMVVTHHPEWARHRKHLSTQAKSSPDSYTHDEVGYNYRLTNLQAALGLAQIEQLNDFIAHKKALYDFYFERLDGKNGLHMLGWRPGTRPNRWFFSVDMKDAAISRDELIRILAENKIQSRSLWDLIHEQAPYHGSLTVGIEKAVDYQNRIVNIPCSTNLSFEDAARVVEVILNAVQPG